MAQPTQQKMFGTDGVRGRANHPPMTVESALALGRAAGMLFRSHKGKHRVVIGKDTRLSCYMFENALISGLCSMGIDTLMLGPFPTPGVAFITRAYRADAGIVISASHNPYWDNGIKFFSSEGYKFPNSWEQKMEQLVAKNEFGDSLPKDGDLGKNAKVSDADGRYIEFAKSTFPKRLSMKGVKIALDCANGATYRVAPLIFQELGAEVILVGNHPNGLNINKGCGALHPETVQKAVLEHHADLGVALDGDGDRLILIDEKAQIVDGDVILAVCAREMQKEGTLKHNRVVSTVMSNFGFLKTMKRMGIDVIQTKVGDRYVIEAMKEEGLNLGGEQSGHLIFHDHNTTGDGLVAALQMLRIMIQKKTSLSELTSNVERCPQALVNVPVREKPPIEDLKDVEAAVTEVQTALNGDGRVLIRYSGTESLCRVMVEGPKPGQVQAMADGIAKQIEQAIGLKGRS